jgi:glutathione S-transferase
MLKLYGFTRVNKGARGGTRDLRVLWALEEMALPFEIVGMDHRTTISIRPRIAR